MSGLASEFPELHRVFAGYLHEDFVLEHGNAAAALDAFVRDGRAAERRRFAAEITRFLTKTSTLDLPAIVPLLAELGCAWVPPSADVLHAVLEGAARRAMLSRPRG